MSNKYNEKQRFDKPLRLPRPCFLTSPDAVSDPAKYAFLCESNALFPVF